MILFVSVVDLHQFVSVVDEGSLSNERFIALMALVQKGLSEIF